MLETARLRLRELTIDDAEFIVAQLNDLAFIHNVTDRGVRTIAAARAYILAGPIASYREHGFGLHLVELKDARVPIGICGLIKRDALDDVDIGFAFLPPYRGQGFALEAARATMAFALRRGLSRVVAIVALHNADSIKLLRKLGFVYERLVRLADDAEELLLFASAPAPGALRYRDKQ